jgi:hypothetical protein
MKGALLAFLVAMAIVPAALADGPSASSPAAACKTLQQTAPAMFGPGKTYRNLGACVSVKSAQAAQNTTNAAKACRTEQADANFAGTHGGKSFADFYGSSSNGNGKGQGNGNAFGKCVSGKAQAATAAQQSAELNAAKQCKAQRADASFAANHGGKSFGDFYGSNGNKKNAFGKCVSALAKAK